MFGVAGEGNFGDSGYIHTYSCCSVTVVVQNLFCSGPELAL